MISLDCHTRPLHNAMLQPVRRGRLGSHRLRIFLIVFAGNRENLDKSMTKVRTIGPQTRQKPAISSPKPPITRPKPANRQPKDRQEDRPSHAINRHKPPKHAFRTAGSRAANATPRSRRFPFREPSPNVPWRMRVAAISVTLRALRVGTTPSGETRHPIRAFQFPSATREHTMGSAAYAPILTCTAAAISGRAVKTAKDVFSVRALSRRPDPVSAMRPGERIDVQENADRCGARGRNASRRP